MNFVILMLLTQTIKMKYLNTILSVLIVVVGVNSAFAQNNDAPLSPPATAMNKVGDVNVKIDYSQPSVKGRVVYGDLVPYGQVWRTGANKASTIEFSQNVMIEGQKVPAGKYSIFTIPEKDNWTVILNSVSDQWGAYNYDKSKDVVRFKIKPHRVDSTIEKLTFDVTPEGEVSMKWADTGIKFMVKGQ
jgi:hypothetical protein